MTDSVAVASERYNQIIRDITEERGKQDAKWGEQNREFATWLAILMEEVGEACKENLNATFGSDPSRENFRYELVQATAVLAAMLECGDRNGWFKEGYRPQ